jgi:hypothetical protein
VSWDATLYDDRGHCEGDWNFTHNCNGMIAQALLDIDGTVVEECDGPLGPAIGPAWWRRLDGMAGPDGAAFLDRVLRGLEADPEKFRAMNPDNGWGDYDSLVKTLAEMRNAVPEWPTQWSASG